MFCMYCGKEIADGSSFCQNCGKSVIESALERPVKSRTTSRGNKRKLVIIGGLCTVIVLGILLIFNNLLGIKVISKTVEAGSVFEVDKVLATVGKNAVIVVDDEIDTDTLGESSIKCTVTNGIFKTCRTISLQVVDTKAPTIKGPKSISIIAGDKFMPTDFYKVTDFEKGLEKKIVTEPSIDTNSTGKQNIKLEVEDSSGNKGTLDIAVNILKLTPEEKVVMQAINQYIADGYDTASIRTCAWIMKTEGATNGVDYYVVLKSDMIYAVYDNGTAKEITIYDTEGEDMHELLICAVEYDGETVITDKLIN